MHSVQVRSNRLFGLFLLISELALILVIGFTLTYSPVASRFISDDYFIISALLILAFIGFGLITTYIRSASVASLTHLIIIFGLSIQLYFPWRGFWEIIGLSGKRWDVNTNNILPVSVTNVLNDRQVSQMYSSSPFTDYIACFISLIICYSAVIGRVGNLEVYFLTFIGTFMYQFTSMIFWRIFVTDCGFGMRIFLFAGFFGLLCSSILGKKITTAVHPLFKSQYYFQGFNLFGAIVIWCLLPVLNWADLWHSPTYGTDSHILHVASLNMWFALCGSVIGSFSACLAIYGKLSIHTIIFSVFSGGIAYTSISDIYLNPGLAMGIGTIASFICGFLQQKIKVRMNSKGIADSNGVVSSFLVPGLFAGLLSAMFHAEGAWTYFSYQANFDSARDRFNQGGIQIAGLAIAIGNGIFAGLVVGGISKIVNKRISEDQLKSEVIVGELPLGKQEDAQN